MRYTPSGKSVSNFAVATNRRFKNADGTTQDQTEFHDVVAWGKLAEISHQYLHKGDPVYVDGRLQTRSWDDDQGQKHYMTEVVAQTVQLLGSRDGGDGGQSRGGGGDDWGNGAPSRPPRQAGGGFSRGGDVEPDDLPFE